MKKLEIVKKVKVCLFLAVFCLLSCKDVLPELQPIPKKPERLIDIEDYIEYRQDLDIHASYLYKYLTSVRTQLRELNHPRYLEYPYFESFDRKSIIINKQDIREIQMHIELYCAYIQKTHKIAEEVYDKYSVK